MVCSSFNSQYQSTGVSSLHSLGKIELRVKKKYTVFFSKHLRHLISNGCVYKNTFLEISIKVRGYVYR